VWLTSAGCSATSQTLLPFTAGASIPGASAAVPKQGAYGKVKIHQETKFSQFSHVDEVFEMVVFKLGFSKIDKITKLDESCVSPAYTFCENMLVKVSRSFAMVIQQLPEHLRMSVCIFYLVLRVSFLSMSFRNQLSISVCIVHTRLQQF
jgi:hypothetical protein